MSFDFQWVSRKTWHEWLGCPIQKSPDQSLVDSSPRLIAASYVLHRSLQSRHPHHALSNLLFFRNTKVSRSAYLHTHFMRWCRDRLTVKNVQYKPATYHLQPTTLLKKYILRFCFRCGLSATGRWSFSLFMLDLYPALYKSAWVYIHFILSQNNLIAFRYHAIHNHFEKDINC